MNDLQLQYDSRTDYPIGEMADQSHTNQMLLKDWSYFSSRMPDMVKSAIAIRLLSNCHIITLAESEPWSFLLFQDRIEQNIGSIEGSKMMLARGLHT